jgi:hypothetical protein
VAGAVAGAQPGVSKTSSASTTTGGAQPTGSTQPSSVMASPKISALDLAEGTSDTYVMINGTNFSTTPGSVYLMVGQGRLIKARVWHWSDTQIYMSMPDTSGVGPMSGQLYVQRGAQQSNFVPFRFLPTLISYTFGWTDDNDLAYFQDPYSTGFANHYGSFFFGLKGDDHFYRSVQLKNGWVVDTAYVESVYFPDRMWPPNKADAYVSEYHPGTPTALLQIHWWTEPSNEIGYIPHLVAVGPKGTWWK